MTMYGLLLFDELCRGCNEKGVLGRCVRGASDDERRGRKQ